MAIQRGVKQKGIDSMYDKKVLMRKVESVAKYDDVEMEDLDEEFI